MDEKTTTDAPVDSGVVEPTQPAPAEPATAAPEATENPEQQADQPVDEATPTGDDPDLSSWAEKKGLKLDSENATKAARMYREAEKRMHETTAKASELEKSLQTSSDEIAEKVAESTGQDPELLKRLQRVEVKEAVRDFWSTPLENGTIPDRKLESAMIKELYAKPHLAGDLESLYATAVLKSGNLDAVKSQGKKEALESLAHSQTAAVPTGNATNSGVTPKTKPFKELSIKEMEAKLGFAKQ